MIQTGDRCPRCGGTTFSEHLCGDDTWDSYSVGYDVCDGCGLWHDENFGHDRWLVDVESCWDREDAEEYIPQ